MGKNKKISIFFILSIIIIFLVGILLYKIMLKNEYKISLNNHINKNENINSNNRNENNNSNEFKIINISKAIKKANIGTLPTKEKYVGDFIKIGKDDINSLGLDYDGYYYVNPKTGEIYDFAGEKYDGIIYHTLEELKQIQKNPKNIDVKSLLNVKYKQLDYIKNNQQHRNGAIATYTRNSTSSSYTIIPYFALCACEDMLIDINSFDAVRKYINWHFEHINMTEDDYGVKGTIYDYKYQGNNEIVIKEYDSIDSYASVFLSLLRQYVERTGDREIILKNKEKIYLVVQALDSTYRTDRNLTQAKSNYNISFLMDNAETYRGYKDFAAICNNILEDRANSVKYNNRANDLKKAIEDKLWNTKAITEQEYMVYDYAYKNSSYDRIKENVEYYPDILAQIYPILYDVIDPNGERAAQIYYIHSYHSNQKWYNYTLTGTYPHLENLEAVLMCSKDTVKAGNKTVSIKQEIEMAIKELIKIGEDSYRSYKWNCQEAGNAIKSVNMYLNRYI